MQLLLKCSLMMTCNGQERETTDLFHLCNVTVRHLCLQHPPATAVPPAFPGCFGSSSAPSQDTPHTGHPNPPKGLIWAKERDGVSYAAFR